MEQWISLQQSETIADFTAGRGALLRPYPKDKCYGIEIDDINFLSLQNSGYKNIVKGDVFDKIHEFADNSIDALVMNPPYGMLGKGRTSMGILSRSIDKIKHGGRVAIICAQNDFVRFAEADDVLNKIKVELAYKFGDDLFKPFASIPTVLIIGVKATPAINHSVTVIDIPNERISINTRSKFPEPKLNVAGADEKTILQSDFRENITGLFTPPPTPPTLEDFRKTVIDYMSYEYKVPREALENPERFWSGFGRMLDDYNNHSTSS